MKSKDFYRGYYLSASSTLEPDATRYMARVAIMSLGGDKTQSQRFLDLQVFDSEQEALNHAVNAGKDWVDAQLVLEVARRLGRPAARLA